MIRAITAFAIILILAAAIMLRVWGLGWGLPNDLHHYSYHPDENVVFGAAIIVNLLEGKIDPGFYNYGSLFIYLTNLAVIAAIMSGLANPMSADLHELANMYLAGRIAALMLGVLTVYIVFLIGRRAYGRWAGITAAALMAVIPLHVMHSKFIAVDVPAAFFVTLVLLFSIRIAQENNRIRDYILAGLFVGFAAATKYNAGLVILSPIAAHIITHKSGFALRIIHPKMIGILIPAVVGFILGTPGVLLNPDAFWRDFIYEAVHASTGHGIVFKDTGLGWIYHLMHSLWPGMGIPLLVLAFIGMIYAFWKHTPQDIILLTFLVAYYTLIGAAEVRFARYIIPILPVLAITAGALLRVTVNNTNPATAKEKRSTPSEPQASNPRAICIGKCLISILIIIVLTYTTFCTAAIDRLYAEEDTRDIAARWIGSNIPHGSSIGLATIPWFYTPPLDPEMALPLVANERYSRALGFKEYLLVVNDEKEWNPSFLEQEMPQYVILSEFEYTDRLRIKDNDTLKYFDILNRDYILEKRFDRDLMLAGMKFPLWADLPHDMSYASPEILIYGRIPALPITKVNIGIIEDTESDNAPTPPAADTRIPEAP